MLTIQFPGVIVICQSQNESQKSAHLDSAAEPSSDLGQFGPLASQLPRKGQIMQGQQEVTLIPGVHQEGS